MFDEKKLQAFYASALGKCVAANLASFIRPHPKTHFLQKDHQTLLAIGYPFPLLPHIKACDINLLVPENTAGAPSVHMAAQEKTAALKNKPPQDPITLTPGITQRTFSLQKAGHLPLKGQAFDHIILLHCLEHAFYPAEILKEVWRLLAPGGRATLFLPRASSAWTAGKALPFSDGETFEEEAIKKLLAESHLMSTQQKAALLLPPQLFDKSTSAASFAEKVLQKLSWSFSSGLWVIHAQKATTCLNTSQDRRTTFGGLALSHT